MNRKIKVGVGLMVAKQEKLPLPADIIHSIAMNELRIK